VEQESRIPISRQCELLSLPRSSFYYEAAGESEENLRLMAAIDEQYLLTPFYGSRRMAVVLSGCFGEPINRKRVQRLMRKMGTEALYPKRRTSQANAEHRVYPYLLRGLRIDRPNQVWSTDITYIRMRRGFLYLVAIMDWYSRYVLSWELSNTLDNAFCVEALERALETGKPEIFNTDQGSQFTSDGFTRVLRQHEIRISMDGRGRALDNVFVERLWRTLKYEEVYLRNYESVRDAYVGIRNYWHFYNEERPHQSLGYRVPAAIISGIDPAPEPIEIHHNFR